MPQIAAEHWLADPIPLEGALCDPPSLRDKTPTTVTCTVSAWHRMLSLAQCPLLYSPLLPLAYHPRMQLLQEKGFRKLLEGTKIPTWGDLYHNGQFWTLPHIFRESQLSPLDIFLYVWLQQGLRSVTPELPHEPPNWPLCIRCYKPPPQGTWSPFYTTQYI